MTQKKIFNEREMKVMILEKLENIMFGMLLCYISILKKKTFKM